MGVTPELISAIVAGLVSGFVASALSIAVFYFKELANVKERLASLGAKVEPFWSGVVRMVSDRIVGTSTSAERKRGLLERLEAGTLRYDEAKELESALRRELEKAREEKEDELVVTPALLLATLKGLIEKGVLKA